MKCNGYTNCGTYTKEGHIFIDDSDETTHCKITVAFELLINTLQIIVNKIALQESV